MDAARAIREADAMCEYGRITVGEYERLIAPFHDVEPVVRCKDCKKRNSWECWQYFFGRIKIPDDWFCADGVRKEG